MSPRHRPVLPTVIQIPAQAAYQAATTAQAATGADVAQCFIAKPTISTKILKKLFTALHQFIVQAAVQVALTGPCQPRKVTVHVIQLQPAAVMKSATPGQAPAAATTA